MKNSGLCLQDNKQTVICFMLTNLYLRLCPPAGEIVAADGISRSIRAFACIFINFHV